MSFSSSSPAETKKIAKDVMRALIKTRSRGARVLALTGGLGAGKTTFVQGLMRALGVKNKVLSPTFILMQPFDIQVSRAKRAFFSRVWHVDCYRVKNPEELLSLGLSRILEDQNNLVVIEWADKIKSFLPKDAARIKLEYGKKENERIITIKNQNARIKSVFRQSFRIPGGVEGQIKIENF